jgi:hypothetical protein
MATMRGIQNRERNWLWLHGIVFCRNHLVPDICKSYDFFFLWGEVWLEGWHEKHRRISYMMAYIFVTPWWL